MELPEDSITAVQLFQRHRQRILLLRTTDPEFRELWANYVEITGEMRIPGVDESALVELGRIRASLEAEILESL